MHSLTIHPARLQGVINVPTSKSLAHRAIICAALAKGESVITNISMSKDIEATIGAMRALGATIIIQGTTLYINGNDTFKEDHVTINCNESGSTLRFMVPVALRNKRQVHFTGGGKLGQRPLDVFYDIFDKQGIAYKHKEGVLDLFIEGQLTSGTFAVPGDISSQFITGLLFVLPLLEGDSKIVVTSPLQSKAYIDLTLDMLERFGIVIDHEDQVFHIRGSQQYKAHDYEVEGDFSQAANFLVAGAIGNDVTIGNLNLDSKQGDRAAITLLEEMGAQMKETPAGIKMMPSHLQCISLDASQCPDIIPVIAVACALAQGTSQIMNAKRLRIKECDRLAATVEVLKACGVDVIELEDAMIIRGTDLFRGARLQTYNDHRMAMMEAIMATRSVGDLILDDASCVAKSYPNFFEHYALLGGSCDEC